MENEKKKIFCVVTVARQIEGDLVLIRFEKAYFQASKAENYAKNLSKNFNETIITRDQQGNSISIECGCERSIQELEVEE